MNNAITRGETPGKGCSPMDWHASNMLYCQGRPKIHTRLT